MRLAESGINELTQYVDTLIIIPNQNLFRVANEKTTFADAFKMADDVLNSGVRGVTGLMVNPGMINLDFADIRAVLSEMGKAMMGTGEADGERSEEHPSELQSLMRISYAVFCLKKNKTHYLIQCFSPSPFLTE